MTITIGKARFQLDMLDADTNERALAAIHKVAEMREGDFEDLSAADAIRKVCRDIFECFNTIFGEGTDKKVFGGRCNLREAMDAFDALADAVVAESQDFGSYVSDKLAKYSPERAARIPPQ